MTAQRKAAPGRTAAAHFTHDADGARRERSAFPAPPSEALAIHPPTTSHTPQTESYASRDDS
jgi:hypothetical protein